MSRLVISRPRLFWIALPLYVVVVAGNHVEHSLRLARNTAAPSDGGPQVSTERGPGGHKTIGIVEKNTAADALTFAQLGSWDFKPEAPSPCPPIVMKHDGSQIGLTGFMYPLSQGDTVKTFCLLRSTQTCCFGPRPQYNQYLLVETREPVPFARLQPIAVTGRFHVDAQPKQGYIYRIDEAAVTLVGGNETPIDAKAYAQAHQLAWWNWEMLDGVSITPGTSLPAALLDCEGQSTVVDGFLLERTMGPPAQFMVGRFPVVGKSGGRAPTLTTAITIQPERGASLPPLWAERVSWQGRVHIVSSSSQWGEQGLVRLEDARPCGVASQAEANRLVLSIWAELMLLLCLVATTCAWKTTSHPRESSS